MKQCLTLLIALLCFLIEPGTVSAQELPSEVRFGYLNGPRPWILGKIDKSFDEAFGTPVRWRSFESGPPALDALAAGEVDIVRVGSVPATSAIIAQAPIKVIALSGIIDKSEKLIAKLDVKSVKDLEMKSVATVFGSTTHYALLAAMNAYGVDSSKVKIVSVNPSEHLSLWEKGEISASYLWGPYWYDMMEHGGHVLLNSGDLNFHGYYLFNAYVVSMDFAEKYPEIVSKFLQIHQLKVDEYNLDHEAAALKIATELGQEPDAVLQTLDGLYYPSISEQLNIEWLGSGKDTQESAIAISFKDQADFLESQALVNRHDVPHSFSPYIDVSFLREAAPK